MIDVTDDTICVIDKVNSWVWDFYPTKESAEQKCAELNEISNKKTYFVGTYADVTQMEKEKYLTGKVNNVTKEIFHEMLEILPPLQWENNGVFECFCMSEFLISNYTEQYGHFNDKYISKTVDFYDKSTYITIEDF